MALGSILQIHQPLLDCEPVQARAQDFSLGGKTEWPEAESWGGVLGEAATHSPLARRSGGTL